MTLKFDYRERMARNRDKRDKIMSFMRGELYSTARVLSEHLGHSQSVVYPPLDALVNEGLLRRSQVDFLGRMISFYVLTIHGATEYPTPGYTPKVHKGPLPLKTLPHTIDTQRIRANGRFRRWLGERWLPGRELKRDDPARWPIYPDAVAVVEDRYQRLSHVAIETERTRKGARRYHEILHRHHQNIRAGRYSYVMYFCPSVKDQKALSAVLETTGSDNLSNVGVYPYPFKP